jgi:hypothetical protein
MSQLRFHGSENRKGAARATGEKAMGADVLDNRLQRVSPEYQANGRNGMTSKKSSKTRESYLSPGVYMEELSSGARPIEAVGTALTWLMIPGPA